MERRELTVHSVLRTPDDAPIRQKMVYASSKDALRKQLVGIAAEIQATSYDEITYEAGKYDAMVRDMQQSS